MTKTLTGYNFMVFVKIS